MVWSARPEGTQHAVPLLRRGVIPLAFITLILGASGWRGPVPALRFEVTVAPGLLNTPQTGRLLLALSPHPEPEPRLVIGHPERRDVFVFGRDVRDFGSGRRAIVDEAAIGVPIERLSQVPAGEYFVQAVFMWNPDIRRPDAPGNLYSAVHRVHLDPARGGAVRLELTRAIPEEEPPETEHVKFVVIRSERLSAFHGRPMYLRAGVILPRDYAREPERRYPLRVHIGGFGTRYTNVLRLMAEDSEFRRAWMAEDAPRMILLHLDGAGPYGDPYYVNSANNGPYGDALVWELIPYVERTFRAIGRPEARVLDGGSTGGWVALALQIFYPEAFNGAWAACPDSVDFRAFQLLNIYEDVNAYVNRYGFERPSARDARGDVRFTMRYECQMENVMGLGDSYTMSGGQWGSWNAAYGPRGADGRPVPLWDPKTGSLNREAVEHWKQYDLRLVLERRWPTLGPKLRGKLRIWMGEADDYFLNNAVYLLEEFLQRADPPADARIVYGPRRGHCWRGVSERELMREMADAIERALDRAH
ncbi:hypothetical protein HRbin08_02163 [bacterium HR08]|nr:hypothetical protein HRbin08_02163 [bacterium HR08]